MASDRPQGATLTPSQRELLRGEADLSDDAARIAESRVVSRVQQSITEDLPLVEETLEAEDLIDITELRELKEGLKSTARLVFQLAQAAGHDADELIEEAVRPLRHDRADELWKALEEGDIRVGFDELEALHTGDRIPDGVYNAALRMRVGKARDLRYEEVLEAWEQHRESDASAPEEFFSTTDEE